MKKYTAIILALMLMLSMAACMPDPGESSTTLTSGVAPGTTAGTSGTTVPTHSTQPTTTTSPVTPTTTPSTVPTGGEEELQSNLKTMIRHHDMQYEFAWTRIDDAKGILTIATVLTASAEEMEAMGLRGALVYKPEICTYEISYTKTDAGVYTAAGSIVSVSAAVEGESAATFIEMMKQSLDTSRLDEMTRRVLDGEVLTEKEDIEWLIWEYDTAVKVTFSVQDGRLVITEFEKTYTSWGFMAPTKEICHIENGVVRRYEEYEQDALVRVTEYRENGVILKCTYYSEGEMTSEVHYDENGEEIV